LHSFVFHSSVAPTVLHSFPTRRSSDLLSSRLRSTFFLRYRPRRRRFARRRTRGLADSPGNRALQETRPRRTRRCRRTCPAASRGDRKSTRLNSSHDQISYAVFCLKKKN